MQCHANRAGGVNVGAALARFGLLKPGTGRYLRYWKAGEANTAPAIWARGALRAGQAAHRSESIAGPAGPLDCRIVTTDDNKPGPESKFWFAKGTQLMVRQESAAGDKALVKALVD